MQGVSEISGNVPAHTITVEYEPAVGTTEAIQQALENIGYNGAVVT